MMKKELERRLSENTGPSDKSAFGVELATGRRPRRTDMREVNRQDYRFDGRSMLSNEAAGS